MINLYYILRFLFQLFHFFKLNPKFIQNLFENNFELIRNECYNIDNKKVLPITMVRQSIYLVKITVQFQAGAVIFCGLTAIGTNRISKTK